MHSLVGLAAVLVAMSAFNNPVAYGIALPGEMLHSSNRVELFIGTFVGAITFTGSIIAFLKLSGKMSGKPIRFTGQHWVNLGLGVAMTGFGIAFFMSPSWTPLLKRRWNPAN
jgi:NAD(P) transhydrogenase subunit beta